MQPAPSLLNLLASLTLALPLVGCAASPAGPYTPPAEIERDTARAEALTRKALAVLDHDTERAEALLREALTADLYHGPAHNDLGVLYLNQSKLYEAANEFEWARKLMPGHPDPRLNLGLTLERAGRFEQALDSYNTALEVFTEHVPSMQAIARLTLRLKRDDPRLKSMLQEIALRGESEQWRGWARLQRTRLDH